MSILSRLEEFILHLNISFNKFEDGVNASRGGISGAIRNNRNIGINVIENILQKYPELNCNWLLLGKGKMILKADELLNEPKETYSLRSDIIHDIQQIPVYSLEATAGLVELFDDFNEKAPIDFLRIPNLSKCDGSMYVSGDSMYPLLKAGDLVAFKKISNIDDGLFWGKMYVLSIDLEGDEMLTVKFIQKSELGVNYVKLVSKNEHHQPMDILKTRIRAIAMVKATVRIE